MKKILLIVFLLCCATAVQGSEWKHFTIDSLNYPDIYSFIIYENKIWLSTTNNQMIMFDIDTKEVKKYDNTDIGLNKQEYKLFNENGKLWAVYQKLQSSWDVEKERFVYKKVDSIYEFNGEKFNITESDRVSYYLGDAFVEWNSNEEKIMMDSALGTVYDVVEAPDGCYWFAGSSLIKYDMNEVITIDSNAYDGNFKGGIGNVEVDGSGNIWYTPFKYKQFLSLLYPTERTYGIKLFNGKDFISFDTTNSELLSNSIIPFVDMKSNIWMIGWKHGSNGLDRWVRYSGLQVYNFEKKMWQQINLPINTSIYDKNLLHKNYPSTRFSHQDPSYRSRVTNHIMQEDSKGRIWIGLKNNAGGNFELGCFNDGEWEIYSIFDFSVEALVPQSFFIDGDDNIVANYGKNGIWKYDGMNWISVLKNMGNNQLTDNSSIYPMRDGNTILLMSEIITIPFSNTFGINSYHIIQNGNLGEKKELQGRALIDAVIDSTYNIWLTSYSSSLKIIGISSYFETIYHLDRSNNYIEFDLYEIINQHSQVLNWELTKDRHKFSPNLAVDNENHLWIGVINQLFEYDLNNNKLLSSSEFGEIEFKTKRSDIIKMDTIYSNNFGKLFIDLSNNVIFQSDGNIYQCNGSNIIAIAGKDINGISVPPLNDIYFSENGDKWFASQKNGIYKWESNDNWEIFKNPICELPSDTIYNIEIDNHKNVWIHHGKGISVYRKGGVILSSEEVPVYETCLTISPNPFSQSTTINYELQEAAHIYLELFDMLGNKIAVLVDGWQEAGKHQAVFNVVNTHACSLPEGVYLLKMATGDGVVTEKVVYVE